MALLIVGGVILVVVVIVVGVYNKLVALKNRFENAFAQIEVQLKRRYDLIPNLVETVKGYMAHERETLEAVIQARNQAASGLQKAAGNPGDPDAIKEVFTGDPRLLHSGEANEFMAEFQTQGADLFGKRAQRNGVRFGTQLAS